MTDERPAARAAVAVRRAADAYGFDVESASWYDGTGPSGTRYEVKSTATRGYRIFEDQHRSLTSAPSAYYVFVRFRADGSVRDMTRRRPSTVTRYVREAGGWVRSGHARTDDRERYIDPDTPF
jgi:pyruvate/2-oxoglutarate dehydrogenase complex dihydrolipoamide acyltransferase (E2) component